MFDSPVFEHQPLVPTNAQGKFDIDSFLTQAKKQQRQWFIAATVFGIISMTFAGYLLSHFPGHMFTTTSALSPISNCSAQTSPSYAFTMVNILLFAAPLICWLDQLRSFLKPAPSNGPSVIVFKPYFVRSTPSDEVTTPEQYFQYIRDRSINWLQTTILIMTLASGIGLSLTFFYSPQSLCTETNSTLRLAYCIGTGVFAATFVSILLAMVYQHKKQIKNTLTLDSYHPL